MTSPAARGQGHGEASSGWAGAAEAYNSDREAKGLLLLPGGKTAEGKLRLDPIPAARPGRAAPWSWEVG